MKRTVIALVGCIFLLCAINARAQEEPKKPKVVKKAEKVNQKSKEINEASNQVLNESQQVAGNVQQTVNNAKAIVKIFEPILRFRLKKKENAQPAVSNETAQTENNANQTASTGTVTENGVSTTTVDNTAYVTSNDIMEGIPVTTESASYNTDGTANLGSQSNKNYGCYIDVTRGAVMDEVDAAGNSKSVDLIFTATNAFNEQVPMYAFLTPSYVKNDAFAYNYFKGTKYKDRNIPPASWDEVNESEVALTSLTAAQFEKIQNNNQLMAVVKQIRGFGQKVESRTKLDGKVVAVKTEMGSRTAYGLIYIQNHYGTTGDNGYLKVKIKVTGFDATGDGNPDNSMYSY